MLRIIILFGLMCSFVNAQSANLETVSDDKLVNLITTEKYMVVFFTQNNCKACDNFENLITDLSKHLMHLLSAKVVKAIDSQLLRLYSTDKEPAVVFFRHGVPLLYDDTCQTYEASKKTNALRHTPRTSPFNDESDWSKWRDAITDDQSQPLVEVSSCFETLILK